jgi:hypothetical protein
MKIDLEPLSGNLRECRHTSGGKSVVVYESDGHIVGIRREHYITIRRLNAVSELRGEFDEIIRNVTSDNITIAFDGQSSLHNVMFSDELENILESGRVKSIRAGNHFGDDSGIESLSPVEFGLVHTSFNRILNKGCQSIEELSLMRFAIHDDTVSYFADGIANLLELEYLALSDLRCSEAVFVHLVRRLVSSFNNLRYLDVTKNYISRETASVLKDVLCNHSKLVFLNVSFCEMDLDSLNLILDGCEITRQMQSLEVGSTIASSTEGMISIENRLISGSLCLLNIGFHDEHGNNGFHDGDDIGEFIRRIRPYMARNYAERKNIELIKTNTLHRLDLPEALESIVCSPDGIENIYKLLIADHNHLLDLFESQKSEK